MIRDGETGSIVTMICDPGERYLDTYFNKAWLADQGLEIEAQMERLRTFADSGRLETG